MNLNHAYGTPPRQEDAAQLLHRALELGITYFDTAALYGFGNNETLVGQVLAAHRSRIFLASKCGMQGIDGKRTIDGRPATLVKTVDDSLRRLRTDALDLCYLHRWDKAVPIEDSIGALSDMRSAGKILAIGVSEVSVTTLRRAHATHPIAAVQSEYSLWTRNPELGILDECHRIGATFVAFSPLGRGFLADSHLDPSGFEPHDIRRPMPRFQQPQWTANRALQYDYWQLATELGHSPAQLALAWLLCKAPHILPVPGTTKMAHLEENLGAANITLTPQQMQRLESLLNASTVHGKRYSAANLKEVDSEEYP